MQKVVRKKVRKVVTEVVEIKKYFCDSCETELGDTKHLCIELGKHAGWVQPPKWQHKHIFEKRPYQFCDFICFRNFIRSGKKNGC